jgi:hypothetical protein
MERSTGQGGEDTSQNREHVENASDNRDALAAQARRTEATTPADLNATARTENASGAGQDANNAQAMREVEENRRALEEQNRRTAASAPANVDMPDTNTSSGRRQGT